MKKGTSLLKSVLDKRINENGSLEYLVEWKSSTQSKWQKKK